jgi:putative SOS response-associated peptidase YedK
MCSQYTIKTDANDLSENYQIKMPPNLGAIDEHIFPKSNAPVIVRDKTDDTRLVGMQFSLVPSWSPEPAVKFATHNTRLETVGCKPTWKIPFKKNHCLVPMTGFYESVYEGPYAGNVIQFKPKAEKVLFAAGIFDRWVDQAGDNQLFSFSILTSNPSQFIQDNGHDRTPIFLNFADGKKWLSLLEREAEMTMFLNTQLEHPELEIEIDRPLKPGWQKRI